LKKGRVVRVNKTSLSLICVYSANGAAPLTCHHQRQEEARLLCRLLEWTHGLWSTGPSIANKEKHHIQLGGFRINARSIPSHLKTEDVTIAIRPEVVRLHEHQEEDYLECEVLWCSYVGAAIEYNLKSSIGEIFAVVPSKDKHFNVGDSIYISVDDIGVSVLED